MRIARAFEKTAFVDRSGVLLDSILANLELEKKLLIARNSSVPFSLRSQIGAQPYVIFTYRLYAFYKKCGDEIMDKASEQLMSVYHAGKIFIPNTPDELILTLQHLKVDTGIFPI